MASRIEDYAIIGDCETAALVARDGSIDWLCLPRFDSAACLAALLGKPQHGRWKLAPKLDNGTTANVKRRYIDDTLVLETEFHLPGGGCVAIIDFMPMRGSSPNLVRIVDGRSGTVPMEMEYIVRFDYGSVVPWLQRDGIGHGKRGVHARWSKAVLDAIAGPDSVRLVCGVEVKNKEFRTVGHFDVHAGERVPFVLTWFPSHEDPPSLIDPFVAMEETQRYWTEWSQRCRCAGKYRDAVIRSLITLKALSYAPTGAIAAAVTTSLPEKIGGVRNWDYRYCWLRDATLTLTALMQAGYIEEARAWRAWLLRAIAGDPSKTQIMYGLRGERRLTELELDWLPGYENSKPVRIGNQASTQFQLDVYGEVLDALYQARKNKLEGDDAGWRLERALLKFLESSWDEPDEGLWEVRGPRRKFTHSRVMTWAAFDRGIKAVEHFGMDGPSDKWREFRKRLHDQICREGFNSELNSFVQTYGSKELDASLLLIPTVGFLPPDDPRVAGTVDAVEKKLLRDGFVLRYDTSETEDGLPPGEGVFLACSFWLADARFLIGRREEAVELFEHLLALRNDVGLLSEEFDPKSKRLVGNFPQAFSHIGLVNTAYNLSPEECSPADARRNGGTALNSAVAPDTSTHRK